MPYTATISRNASAVGQSWNGVRTLTTDGQLGKSPTIAAAKTGTLTTRTSDTAGTLTMASGHGITTGAKIDIYWSSGQATNATAGTVSGNSVPFTSATGPVLPAADTAVTVMVQRDEDFSFLDANLAALFVGAGTAACTATFKTSGGTVVGVVRVSASSDGVNSNHYVWDDQSGVTIPVSDDVATVSLTHGDSAASRAVSVLAMLN